MPNINHVIISNEAVNGFDFIPVGIQEVTPKAVKQGLELSLEFELDSVKIIKDGLRWIVYAGLDCNPVLAEFIIYPLLKI